MSDGCGRPLNARGTTEPAGDGVACRWEVDASDRLVAFGGAWGEFARSNGASELASEALLGVPLLSFVAGAEVRQMYGRLLASVRATGRPLRFEIHCDSPEVERRLELSMEAAPAGAVVFFSRVLRIVARDPVPLLERDRHRSARVLRACSFCRRIERRPSLWLGAAELYVELGAEERERPPHLVESLCAACEGRLHAALPA